MGGLGFDLSPAEVYAQELRIKGAKKPLPFAVTVRSVVESLSIPIQRER